MKQRKYIINKGKLILQYVQFHKDIPVNHEYTSSGGKWWRDENNKILYLYDLSTQFGPTMTEELEGAEVPQWAKEYKIILNPYIEFLYEIGIYEKEESLQLV